jgi:hypothetical protein
MDGFDRTWYSVSKDAAFVAIAKASADQINAWAKHVDGRRLRWFPDQTLHIKPITNARESPMICNGP